MERLRCDDSVFDHLELGEADFGVVGQASFELIEAVDESAQSVGDFLQKHRKPSRHLSIHVLANQPTERHAANLGFRGSPRPVKEGAFSATSNRSLTMSMQTLSSERRGSKADSDSRACM